MLWLFTLCWNSVYQIDSGFRYFFVINNVFSKLSWLNQYKPHFKIFLIVRIRGLEYGEGNLLKAERRRQNSDISAL